MSNNNLIWKSLVFAIIIIAGMIVIQSSGRLNENNENLSNYPSDHLISETLLNDNFNYPKQIVLEQNKANRDFKNG